MPRQSKGERDALLCRPPVEVGAIIRRRAKEADVPYSDVVSAILSEYVGLSYLMPMPGSDHTHKQQELDLPAA